MNWSSSIKGISATKPHRPHSTRIWPLRPVLSSSGQPSSRGRSGNTNSYLDAGHIAQSLALAAVSLDLGTCQIAALYDDEVNSLLEIDGTEESVLYMSVVGHPQGF